MVQANSPLEETGFLPAIPEIISQGLLGGLSRGSSTLNPLAVGSSSRWSLDRRRQRPRGLSLHLALCHPRNNLLV